MESEHERNIPVACLKTKGAYDMPYLLSYMKKGEGIYPPDLYPQQKDQPGYLCDLEHSMHLAVSDDGRRFIPLKNNTGILFPECDLSDGVIKGTTKTLIDPFLIRGRDGFYVLGVRRNQNAPDPTSTGCAIVYFSSDLVEYSVYGFLKLSDKEIRRPRAWFDKDTDLYTVEWETEEGDVRSAFSGHLKEVYGTEEKNQRNIGAADDCGVPGAIPGSLIEITDEECFRLKSWFLPPENTGVRVPDVEGITEFGSLPGAVCEYSDGSEHVKPVEWDRSAFEAIDPGVPGEYEIKGRIRSRHWPFPLPLSAPPEGMGGVPGVSGAVSGYMSDPCVTEHNGRYYLTSSGSTDIVIRAADTLEGVFTAPAKVMCSVPSENGKKIGTWAAELHVIKDIPYLFTGICPGEWTTVEAAVLRCKGDIEDPSAWEEPRFCVKPDGSMLTEGGISLDMTEFEIRGVHYVMWSDRKIHEIDGKLYPAPADIYIAIIDPDRPWQLISEPQCVMRPVYGWDRCQTEVEEGPYLLRRGDDLFVCVSGSSTGMADLYTLGFLRAKAGDDLLDPSVWKWYPWPFMTKESVPGMFGPGHNCFIKDPETGDDLIIFHAVPHKDGVPQGRRPAVRRVHWNANGLPNLEMTEERDLKEEFREVTCRIIIR